MRGLVGLFRTPSWNNKQGEAWIPSLSDDLPKGGHCLGAGSEVPVSLGTKRCRKHCEGLRGQLAQPLILGMGTGLRLREFLVSAGGAFKIRCWLAGPAHQAISACSGSSI